MVFTRRGRLNLRNARFADDPRPVDPLSSSPMARDYSRAYWRHLVKSGEILAMMGLTEINLAYYQDLMAGARLAISEGRLDAYIDETQRNWAEGEAEGRCKAAAKQSSVQAPSAEPAQICISEGVTSGSAPLLFRRASRKFVAKNKGRDAFPAARPFFHSCSAFYNLGLFYLLSRPRIVRRFKTVERVVLPQTLRRPAPNLLAAASF